MSTVFVEGSSGSIIKMDIPTDPHGAERYAADIANGRLTVIDESRIIETRNPRWPDSVIYQIDRSVAAKADVEANASVVDQPGSELADKSKPELFDMAAGLGVETKASWSKAQLIAALEAHTPSTDSPDDDHDEDATDPADDSED
jgi:hypothetical protein